MRLFQVIAVSFLLATLLTVGCQSPPNSDSPASVDGGSNSRGSNSRWFTVGGQATGIDSRAREIERRLGYE